MSRNLTKRQLRNILLTRLKRQTEEQRERKSKLIERKLIKQEEFIKAKRILFYLAFDDEVKTENMINKARELGKEIYVPVCDTKDKALRPCVFRNGALLQKGPYQTLEPQTKIDLSLDKLDLVLVPALGFDKNGNRLGRGKGYYDRLLKKTPYPMHSIGLAFDFQILHTLPVEQNDVPVDKILSA
jgi:5-formyltetrahydrofolate cyclo-ligase